MRNLKYKPILSFGEDEDYPPQSEPRNVIYAALRPQRPTVRVGGMPPLRSVAPLPSFMAPLQPQRQPKPRAYQVQEERRPQHRALQSQPVRTRPVGHRSARPLGQLVDWFNEELTLTMSKLSLLGMVFGLMFMGALFFVVGFLSAVSMYAKSTGPQPTPTQAWTTHSQQQAEPHPHHGVGSHLASSVEDYEGRRASRAVTSATTRPVMALASKVPAPLRPFATQAALSVSHEVNRTAHHGIHGATHLSPNPFGRAATHVPAQPLPMAYPHAQSRQPYPQQQQLRPVYQQPPVMSQPSPPMYAQPQSQFQPQQQQPQQLYAPAPYQQP